MTRASAIVLAFTLLTGLAGVPASSAADCDARRLEDFGGKRILLRDDTLLFSTDILKIDIDGSARSYGMHDQGVEHICNGLSAAEPVECRNAFARGRCFTACVDSFRRWHGESGDPADLGRYMRAIGLGGANGSIPDVRLQQPPNDAMFVSHTSVRYGPWKQGDPRDGIERQQAQMEPFEVPFFVIPGRFRRSQWDATPGDVGVIVNANVPERPVFFVVGDTGGNLDEGSAKLQELLSGRPLVPQRKPNLFGELVDRYGDLSYTREGGRPIDLRVAIFRHTSTYDRSLSGPTIVLQTIPDQDAMLSYIQETAGQRLAAFGGIEAVIACTD